MGLDQISGFCRLLVVVSLCPVLVMCVHWFGSDIRLCRLCSVPVVCVCACIGCCSSSATCSCQSVLFQLHVCGFGSDIGLCRLLVAVSLCSVSVVCVCGFGSDIGLHRLLVAVSLCSISVVRVRALVWIRYRALSATCSCQYVFCSSCLFNSSGATLGGVHNR